MCLVHLLFPNWTPSMLQRRYCGLVWLKERISKRHMFQRDSTPMINNHVKFDSHHHWGYRLVWSFNEYENSSLSLIINKISIWAPNYLMMEVATTSTWTRWECLSKSQGCILPPFQNKDHVLENSVGFMSFFALFARNCVRRIALLTERFPASQGCP